MSDSSPTFFGSLTADMAAGLSAGFIVSPFISVVDKALAENASGRAKLGQSLISSMKDLLKSPVKFFTSPAFRWIWLVYGATYTAANILDSYGEQKKKGVAFEKWVATSVTNTTTCIMKDRAYARLFGAGNTPVKVPLGSYGVWLARDSISMGVIFTMPKYVASSVAKYTNNEKLALYSAQFCLPLLLQTVTTPLHLLGFNIANAPNATLGERLTFLKTDYFKNVGLRMVRMFFPWSLGNIGNTQLRSTYTSVFNKNNGSTSGAANTNKL